ncbi:MAG: energy transducer TonB [Rhodothermaceae bacterium]
MALTKNPKFDLKLKWRRIFEISLIVALAVLIIAFKYFPRFEEEKVEQVVFEEEVNVEEIQNTKQENKPPPPPKPPVPIEAPSDDVLDDIEIEDMEMDIDEVVEAPPPPVEEEEEEEEEAVFFAAVEQMPEPIGGIGAIQKKIVYPELAKRAGVQGRVFIKAYVDERGNVTKVELVKGIGAGCDEEALKAVKATQFKPGKQRMKPVKVQVVVPVIFKLQ